MEVILSSELLASVCDYEINTIWVTSEGFIGSTIAMVVIDRQRRRTISRADVLGRTNSKCAERTRGPDDRLEQI